MPNLLGVMIGGATGSVCRYLIQEFSRAHLSSFWGTFVGTFCINITGAFLAGLFYSRTDWLRPVISIGFLGGFTTFSAYCVESVMAFQSGLKMQAMAYAILSPAAGMLAFLSSATFFK